MLGHAITFNIQINGQEMVIIIQNICYLAQLISEGMHLAMNNYTNQMWINNILHPLALTMNHTLIQNATPLEPTTNSQHTCASKSPNEPLILPTIGDHSSEPNIHAMGSACKPRTSPGGQ